MEKHIIHKVYLELTTSSVAEAQKLKDNIGSFLNLEVFPLLEKQIDAMDRNMSQYAIQLDKVNVEITEKGIHLNDDLKYTIVEKIEAETQEVIKTVSNHQKTQEEILKNRRISHKSEHQLETLIHFFKTGTNPWWSTESITKLLTPKAFRKLIETPDFTRKIIRILKDKTVRERIVTQLTKLTIKELYVVLAKESDMLYVTEQEFKEIYKRPNPEQQQIWKEIFAAIAHHESTDIIKLIATIKEEIALNKTIEKQLAKEIKLNNKTGTKDLPPNNEGITKDLIEALINPKNDLEKEIVQNNDEVVIEEQYVQNAGLVLIHPFLIHFFKHCNLLDDQKQLKGPERCAHLLHYIATGKTKQAESDMIFEKFLCNIPSHQPINRNVTITKKQKEQVENLLNAVNKNWGALKMSSHALLQNEFLQRMGKVEKNSSGTTIQIEKKTQDILLRKLSWGLGLIKLPWKKDFIYVNW